MSVPSLPSRTVSIDVARQLMLKLPPPEQAQVKKAIDAATAKGQKQVVVQAGWLKGPNLKAIEALMAGRADSGFSAASSKPKPKLSLDGGGAPPPVAAPRIPLAGDKDTVLDAIDKLGPGQTMGVTPTAGRGVAEDVWKAADGAKVSALGDGQTYKLSMEASVAAQVSVSGSAAVSVARDGNKYTVTTSADAAIGAKLSAGLKAGAGADASASAGVELGLSGAQTFTFDNAADSKKAVGIILDVAAQDTVKAGGAVAAGPVGAYVANKAGDSLFVNSKGDGDQRLAFLRQHLTKTELDAKGTASAEATLSAKLSSALSFGADASVKATLQVGLEKYTDGKPNELVASATLKGSAGENLSVKVPNEVSLKSSVSASAQAKLEVRMPAADVRAQDPLKNASATLTGSVELSATPLSLKAGKVSLGSADAGVKLQLKADAKPEALTGPARQFAGGDVYGALAKMDAATKVTVSFVPSASVTSSAKLGGDLKVGPASVGLTGSSEVTQDFGGKPLKEISGTPQQVAAQLKALLAN
jgi:hypothetical protein